MAKRRKIGIDPRDETSSALTCINDLSNDNLVLIAKFLPKTSRAILAVALTAPPSSWRERGWKAELNGASQAIISSKETGWCLKEYDEAPQWEVLEFDIDLERELSSRISDDDISAILMCIDAKTTLKRLKINYCYNIIGYGLEPLRASKVLEKIDLVDRFEESKLSEDVVFLIVCDVIGAEGNSFQRLYGVRDIFRDKGKGTAFFEGYKYAWNESTQCCYFGFTCTPTEYVRDISDNHGWDSDDACEDCENHNFGTCEQCRTTFCLPCDKEDQDDFFVEMRRM